ncbi:hypothetical protein [Qipengyuania sp. MTN3-11]|uniref:hypothetical protein n=1 Tax=Qipengyuania sp. MTN3-11 TaxID=3056557 RepID=UPI0036F3D514
MEFEIRDDPQGSWDEHEGDRDGGVVADHRALRNQSSVQPGDYPAEERRAQRLTEVEAAND